MANPQVTGAAVVSAIDNTIRVNFDQPMRGDAAFYNVLNWTVSGHTVVSVSSSLGMSVALLQLDSEMRTGMAIDVLVENVNNEYAEPIGVSNTASFSGAGVSPRIDSVIVADSKTLSVVFSEDLTESAALQIITNYNFIAPIGATAITATAATVFNPVTITLNLNVEMTDGATYILQINASEFVDLAGNAVDTTDNSFEFVGVGSPPEMASAILESNGRLTVTFDEDMANDANLVSKYNYIVEPTTTGAAVFVKSVKRINARTISLEISETTNGTAYIVIADGIYDASKNVINPAANSAAFNGAGASPKVLFVKAIGPNRVDVIFSEEMMDNDDLRDPSHYSFSGGLIVLSATPDVADARIVALVTSEWIPNTEYTLTITP